MRVPGSTYRCQFNRNFRFQDARKLVPYLHALGISDLYASPLFQARPGSNHGYDVIDPARLNPELGSCEDYQALLRALEQYGLGMVLDIVPNHMAASSDNRWLRDVLEEGPASPRARVFDIDWYPAKRALQGKVLLPILGSPYGIALENQEIVLSLDAGGFYINYYENKLPLAIESYTRVLSFRLDAMEEADGPKQRGLSALRRLVGQIETLHKWAASGGRNPDLLSASGPSPANQAADSPAEGTTATAAVIKQDLWSLYQSDRQVRSFLDDNVRIFNGQKGDPASFEQLDRLLDQQHYWLTFWRLANEEINYRRFFSISQLVSVRVEDPAVFDDTHALVLKLMESKQVTGLRVDHVDGLNDPRAYLDRLRSAALMHRAALETAAEPYLIVEKILESKEDLPSDWPVAGTTGYDFLNSLNGIFVDPVGLRALESVYRKFTGIKARFGDIVYDRKKLVITTLFGGEMRSLGLMLAHIAEQDRYARDLPLEELQQALIEVTACFPVYRTYTAGFQVTDRDRGYVAAALEEARVRRPELSRPAFDFLGRVLMLQETASTDRDRQEHCLRFVMRWQQFTGPIMAKGFEDTALYVFNRLASVNEVGGDPGDGAVSLEQFHSQMELRRRRWPNTLNATSTHDTKRGEDVRARINVLSEIPAEWKAAVGRWSRWNREYVQEIKGHPAPDRNEEYLIYQTLIGAWPLGKQSISSFRERLEQYVVKAAREAKVHTRWIKPDAEREKALTDFAAALLKPSAARFLRDFEKFHRRVAWHGALNGLSQALIKVGAPGVPDFYQGSELWDLRLVDPDNREPVDFDVRARSLRSMMESEQNLPQLIRKLLEGWENGRAKLYLTAKALNFRRAHADLFLCGDYLPLAAAGKLKRHVCAFARRQGAAWAVIVAPRWFAAIAGPGRLPVGRGAWGNSTLSLPGEAPRHWLNVLTGERITRPERSTNALPLWSVFQSFPVALLAGGAI
jgi:(1->4)-alpha-D-glucan 1-alpha-D-glucosylmutase